MKTILRLKDDQNARLSCRGFDILAGRGPLGLDSPTLIVEVKSEPGPIASPVVGQGGGQQPHPPQGPLGASGGPRGHPQGHARPGRPPTPPPRGAHESVTRPPPRPLRPTPPQRARAHPLKQAWVLDEETG